MIRVGLYMTDICSELGRISMLFSHNGTIALLKQARSVHKASVLNICTRHTEIHGIDVFRETPCRRVYFLIKRGIAFTSAVSRSIMRLCERAFVFPCTLCEYRRRKRARARVHKKIAQSLGGRCGREGGVGWYGHVSFLPLRSRMSTLHSSVLAS